MRLVEWPAVRVLVVAGYLDHFAAADDLMGILARRPIGLEGFDASATETMEGLGLARSARRCRRAAPGSSSSSAARRSRRHWRRRTRSSPTSRAARRRRRCSGPIRPSSTWLDRARVRARREPRPREVRDVAVLRGLGRPSVAARRLPARVQPGARPPRPAVRVLRPLRPGCVHCRINFDLRSHEGLRTFRHFLEEASDLVLSFGGSLSGEHGDGQAHAHHLEKMYGPELVDAFREFKRAGTPTGR